MMNEGEIKKELTEQRRILEEILERIDENRKKIHSVRGYLRRMFIMKLVYWIILILLTAGAIYAIKPYFIQGVRRYQEIVTALEEITHSRLMEKSEKFFQDPTLLQKIFELNLK